MPPIPGRATIDVRPSQRAGNNPVAAVPRCALRFEAVMSASVKPRLAGRQPSNRGGVPRVIDQVE
jgi:hypothetical protein